MIDYVNLAIKNNFFAKVEALADGEGVVLNLPANMLLNLQPISYIYTIDSDGVQLYNNSFEMLAKLDAPESSVRIVTAFDILTKAFKYKISPPLVICYVDDKVVGASQHIVNLMSPVPDSDFEARFKQAILNIHNDTFLIDKDISEVFNKIKSNITVYGDVIC